MPWSFYALHGVIGLVAFGGLASLGHLRWKDTTTGGSEVSPSDNGLD